jgi:hypothetical protein
MGLEVRYASVQNYASLSPFVGSLESRRLACAVILMNNSRSTE